jgi:hypothetical protein
LHVMRQSVDQPECLLRHWSVAGQEIDVPIKIFRRAIPGCEGWFRDRNRTDFGGNAIGYNAAKRDNVSRRASSEPKTRTWRRIGVVLALDVTSARENKQRAQLDYWIANKPVAVTFALPVIDISKRGALLINRGQA